MGASACLILFIMQTCVLPKGRMFALPGLLLIPVGVFITLWIWELILGGLSLLFLCTEKILVNVLHP